MLDGRKPVISDGFGVDKRGGTGHLGVDVMFKRPFKGEMKPPELAPLYEAPSGRCFILAPADGMIVSANLTTRGYRITIDHGKVPGYEAEVVTFYTHMQSLLVQHSDVTARSRQRVVQGQRLGIMGADPKQGAAGLNHLHFEFWDMSRLQGRDFSNALVAVDPAPIMKGWGYRGPSGTFIAGSGGTVRSGGPNGPADGVAGAAFEALDILDGPGSVLP